MGHLTNMALSSAGTAAGVIGGASGALAKLFDKSRPRGLFTKPSQGLSHLQFVPRVLTGPGAVAVIGLSGLASIASDVHANMGSVKVGKVKYGDSMNRMTAPYTTGAVKAMNEAANGDYGTFYEMAAPMFRSDNVVARTLDDYGANPAFISSLYNMR